MIAVCFGVWGFDVVGFGVGLLACLYISEFVLGRLVSVVWFCVGWVWDLDFRSFLVPWGLV